MTYIYDNRNNDRGFTLVELLIVVSIILILAALIFPIVTSLKDRSYKTKTKAILTSVDGAIRGFKNDFDTYPLVQNITWNDDDSSKINDDNWGASEYVPKTIVDLYYGRDDDNNGVADDGATGIQSYIDKKSVRTKEYSELDGAKNGLVSSSHPTIMVDAWDMPLIYIFNTGTLSAPNDTRPTDAPAAKSGMSEEFELWSAGKDKKFKDLRSAGADSDNIGASEKYDN